MGCGVSSDSATPAHSNQLTRSDEGAERRDQSSRPLNSVVPSSTAASNKQDGDPTTGPNHRTTVVGEVATPRDAPASPVDRASERTAATQAQAAAAAKSEAPGPTVRSSAAASSSPLRPSASETTTKSTERSPPSSSSPPAGGGGGAVPVPPPAAPLPISASQKPVTLGERAARGDAEAMLALGEALEKKAEGGGGPSSTAAIEAFEWYQRAAAAGSAQGISYAAWCLRTGFGTQKAPDAAGALGMYRKAAEKGYAKAQAALGYMLQKGEGNGGAVDVSAAAEWYRLAAEQNEATAQLNLALLYECGSVRVPTNGRSSSSNNLSDDSSQLAEAFRLFLASAQQGNVNACINVGYAFERGKGVAADMASAFEWYRKAAEAGDDTAQAIVGCCFERGLGIPAADVLEAKRWYKKSALQGNQHARQGLKRIAVETGAVK